MKSLEMVDYYLMCLEEAKTNMCVTCKEHLEQIKQDLEVLEIIRKRRVDIDALIRIIRINSEKSNEKMLYDYNCIVVKIYKLTMEELLKLKQWLEKSNNEA